MREEVELRAFVQHPPDTLEIGAKAECRRLKPASEIKDKRLGRDAEASLYLNKAMPRALADC
jgi:hypothetical protein